MCVECLANGCVALVAWLKLIGKKVDVTNVKLKPHNLLLFNKLILMKEKYLNLYLKKKPNCKIMMAKAENFIEFYRENFQNKNNQFVWKDIFPTSQIS